MDVDIPAILGSLLQSLIVAGSEVPGWKMQKTIKYSLNTFDHIIIVSGQ